MAHTHLNGWKEIAQYLGLSVRTVQRWEKQGLPVLRPLGKSPGAVASSAEMLDEWLVTRRTACPQCVGYQERIVELEKQCDFLRAQLQDSLPSVQQRLEKLLADSRLSMVRSNDTVAQSKVRLGTRVRIS